MTEEFIKQLAERQGLTVIFNQYCHCIYFVKDWIVMENPKVALKGRWGYTFKSVKCRDHE